MSEKIYELITLAVTRPDGWTRSKVEQIVKYPDYDRQDLIHECYLEWMDKPYEEDLFTTKKEVYKKLKRLLYHLQKRKDVEMLDGNETYPDNKMDGLDRVYDYFSSQEVDALNGNATRQEIADERDETYAAFQRRLLRKLNKFKEDPHPK